MDQISIKTPNPKCRSYCCSSAFCQDRRQKELLHSASSRAMEQPAKQPQSRKKAGVLQEETQSSESKQLEDKENVSQERRQVWKWKWKLPVNQNNTGGKPAEQLQKRWTTTRWQPTTPSDVSTIPLPGVLDTSHHVSCIIEFIDWRYSQSCWYFRPLLWTSAPLSFSLVHLPPPPPPPVKNNGGWFYKLG